MGAMMFNGVSTEDMGVVIQTPPVYEFPAKDYTVTHIPGKTGDILIDYGSYQNVNRTYYLALVFRPGTSFVANANAIVSWLMAAKGYVRLEDSYESDYFRLAMFMNPGQMGNMWDKATTIAITFACKPQRYLKTGDAEIDVDYNTFFKIVNPTDQIAYPEFSFEGDSLKIDMYAGDDYNNPTHESSLTMDTTATVQSIVIDCELQDVYKEGSYLNSITTINNGFPKLYPGVNWIKYSTDIGENLKIKPRWWTL